MDVQPETTTPGDEKKSINWSAFILWPFVVLVIYVLSAGPVAMMVHERKFPVTDFMWRLYEPLDWAYENSLLHKPLGIYLHLWAPDKFDRNGNEK